MTGRGDVPPLPPISLCVRRPPRAWPRSRRRHRGGTQTRASPQPPSPKPTRDPVPPWSPFTSPRRAGCEVAREAQQHAECDVSTAMAHLPRLRFAATDPVHAQATALTTELFQRMSSLLEGELQGMFPAWVLSSCLPLTTALPGRGSTGAQGASRAEGRPRSAVCSWRGGLHVARTNELGDPEQVPVRSARRPYRGAACTAKDVLAFRRPPTVVAEHTLHRREMAQYTSGLVAIMDSLRQKRAPSPYRPSQAPALEGVSPEALSNGAGTGRCKDAPRQASRVAAAVGTRVRWLQARSSSHRSTPSTRFRTGDSTVTLCCPAVPCLAQRACPRAVTGRVTLGHPISRHTVRTAWRSWRMWPSIWTTTLRGLVRCVHIPRPPATHANRGCCKKAQCDECADMSVLTSAGRSAEVQVGNVLRDA